MTGINLKSIELNLSSDEVVALVTVLEHPNLDVLQYKVEIINVLEKVKAIKTRIDFVNEDKGSSL